MNRYRLALHAGVKGVDVRLDDPSGPYYLAEDVHHLLRRVQRQRSHAAQCCCWDCDALQNDIAATLGETHPPGIVYCQSRSHDLTYARAQSQKLVDAFSNLMSERTRARYCFDCGIPLPDHWSFSRCEKHVSSLGKPTTVAPPTADARESTAWSTDGDCHCIHCGLTWDMHLADGRSSCPRPRKEQSGSTDETGVSCEHDWWRTADRPGQHEDTCLICGAVRDAT